jgi:hypothetical protein
MVREAIRGTKRQFIYTRTDAVSEGTHELSDRIGTRCYISSLSEGIDAACLPGHVVVVQNIPNERHVRTLRHLTWTSALNYSEMSRLGNLID